MTCLTPAERAPAQPSRLTTASGSCNWASAFSGSPRKRPKALSKRHCRPATAHIDTAAANRNGTAVGAALVGSGIPREELFVTTKVRTGEPGLVHDNLQHSRAALGLDYVDLYLIHGPVESAGLAPAGWKAMEELYAAGLTRAIGVSNLMADYLDRLLAEAVVVPAVNQIEIRPTFQQQALVAKSRCWALRLGRATPRAGTPTLVTAR